MKRITVATGVVLPALLAISTGCGEDYQYECNDEQTACDDGCKNLVADEENCGACGAVCDDGQSCVASECVAEVVCEAPMTACGDDCVDTETSADHCGECDAACTEFGDCEAGACAEPLAAIQTEFQTKGVEPRDLWILQDVTFALTQITGTGGGIRIIEHTVLPDGRVLVLAVDQADVHELWLASPRGGTLTRVNGTLVAGGDVLPGIVVSADGSRVLYRADQDTDDVIDLYSVALASPGTSHKLNGTLVAGGEVSRVFALSADGDRAAYVADEDTDELDEAYTVDLSGATPGAAVKLNPVITSSVWDLALSADGSRVLYRADNPSLGRLELNLVAVASPGIATPIVHADGAEGHVEAYRFSPDGEAVFFTGGTEYLDESLWHAPLNPVAEATRLVDAGDYQWVRPDIVVAPGGTRVYFRKVSGAFGFDRLFRVDVATPLAEVQLSPVGDTSAEEVSDFALADDGNSIVYRGGADGAEGGLDQPGTNEPYPFFGRAPALYHIDLTAAAPPAPTLLSAAVDTLNDEGIAGGYVVAGDGTRVVYRADHDAPFITDAYVVSLDAAGDVTKVSPPLGGVGEASDVARLSWF